MRNRLASRSAKAAYYWLLGWPMALNGVIYKNILSPRSGIVRVQLGPGQQNYLKGWINVDANLFVRRDVWADLRNALPFRDGTIDACYSHHVIEHLPDCSLQEHFCELFRILKPGGIIRVGESNGDVAASRLVAGDLEWFPSWPDDRKSVGGRFVNFIFIRNEHLTMLTHSYLNELATNAGFVDIKSVRPAKETHYSGVIDPCVLGNEHDEPADRHHTLIIEARKP